MPGQTVQIYYHTEDYAATGDVGTISHIGPEFQPYFYLPTDTVYCTAFGAELDTTGLPDFNDPCLVFSNSIAMIVVQNVGAVGTYDCFFYACNPAAYTTEYAVTGGIAELLQTGSYHIGGLFQLTIPYGETFTLGPYPINWQNAGFRPISDSYGVNGCFTYGEECLIIPPTTYIAQLDSEFTSATTVQSTISLVSPHLASLISIIYGNNKIFEVAFEEDEFNDTTIVFNHELERPLHFVDYEIKIAEKGIGFCNPWYRQIVSPFPPTEPHVFSYLNEQHETIIEIRQNESSQFFCRIYDLNGRSSKADNILFTPLDQPVDPPIGPIWRINTKEIGITPGLYVLHLWNEQHNESLKFYVP